MSFDAIFSGPPAGSPFPSAGATVTSGLDTFTGAEWVNVGKGWQPNNSAVAKAFVLDTTAAQATLLVFTAPVSGLYRVTLLSVQATSTGGTFSTAEAAYTEASTAVAATAALDAAGGVSGGTGVNKGDSYASSAVVNALAGTTITLDVSAPTTLTANEFGRIEYLG